MELKRRTSSDSTEAALVELELQDLIPEGPGWQKRKSVEMRTAILEATIDCLEKYGYAHTTTQLVTEMAKVSRGAMLHHYATKRDLIASVLDFTFYKRMQAYLTRMKALTEQERLAMAGMELLWEMLESREFIAYLELATAARTDTELREIFLPNARRFDRMQREAAFRIFPEWARRHEEHMLAIDFTVATMEGLLLNRDIWDADSRRKLVRDFLSQMISMLRLGQLNSPKPGRASRAAVSAARRRREAARV